MLILILFALILGYSAGAAEEIRTRQMKRSRIVDIPPSSQFTPEQVRKDQSQLRPGICSKYFLSLEKLTRKKAEQFSKLLLWDARIDQNTNFAKLSSVKWHFL